jgi:hypothetical protein
MVEVSARARAARQCALCWTLSVRSALNHRRLAVLERRGPPSLEASPLPAACADATPHSNHWLFTRAQLATARAEDERYAEHPDEVAAIGVWACNSESGGTAARA